jgi:hypothetical protein
MVVFRGRLHGLPLVGFVRSVTPAQIDMKSAGHPSSRSLQAEFTKVLVDIH